MHNTTPDYAITKPGMPPNQRKLVRTYGRRTPSAAPEPRSEPPAKKRRTSPDAQDTITVHTPEEDSRSSAKAENQREQSTDQEDISSEAEHEDEEKSKSSILSYFRPVKAAADEFPSNNKIPPSSPPSPPTSPPVVRVKRKRAPRLLKLRPVTQASIEQSEEDAESEDPHSASIDELEGSIKAHHKDVVSKTDAGSGLCNIGSPTESEATSEASSISRLKPGHRSLVQTTLNISSKAPFSECSLCNIVWNPFFPDDVKFHKNRHTAMLRVQKRKEGSLL